MELLTHAQCEQVTGASGAYDPAYAGASAKQSQSGIGYGGQANGFVGTQTNCMDLGTIIRENPCASAIVGGAIAGSTSVPGLVRGVVGGAITGCLSGGNGNGGGSGNNYGGQCTW